ncbi:hypothetical protein Vi05172_g10063 [Venturia inaequalis]|nr:hypothetical protein Vi05172_g10063 [Venturia inaequalis]
MATAMPRIIAFQAAPSDDKTTILPHLEQAGRTIDKIFADAPSKHLNIKRRAVW